MIMADTPSSNKFILLSGTQQCAARWMERNDLDHFQVIVITTKDSVRRLRGIGGQWSVVTLRDWDIVSRETKEIVNEELSALRALGIVL